MNIIEAVRSGKKFRYVPGTHWLHVGLGGEIRMEDETRYCLTQSEIMWPNWEVEEKKLEITKSQLGAALRECWFGTGNSAAFEDRLYERLGFK